MNAAEAIEREGVITVRTRSDGSNVTLAFSDTGPGIPEELQAKVFDPGFAIKGVGVGAGLGLAIGYTIVSEHGAESTWSRNLGAGPRSP